MARRWSESSCVSSRILQAYEQLLNLGSEAMEEVGSVVPIPQIPEPALRDLCQDALHVLQAQSSILLLRGNYTVIGDIHGNLVDLLRILWEVQRPPCGQLLFLGDIVDRGAFSTEVVTLILALLVAYPDHVAIIRGNHEFAHVCQNYGFHAEFMGIYNSPDLWNLVLQVFAWMPVAAVVNNTFFCVHGGISENYPTISSIAEIPRPIFQVTGDPIADFFWSDPTTVYQLYAPSTRGTGRMYGPTAVTEFLDTNNLRQIVRAHEVVKEGVKLSLEGRVMTVFSTSDGAWPEKNQIAFIRMDHTDAQHPAVPRVLPPGPTLARNDVCFKPCCGENGRRVGLSTSVLHVNLALPRSASSMQRWEPIRRAKTVEIRPRTLVNQRLSFPETLV
jgi:protein phosphatase